MKLRHLAFVALLPLALVACKKHETVKHETVKLEHLVPGNSHQAEYAFRDDSGWWWYYMMMQTNTTTSSTASTSTSTSRTADYSTRTYSYPSASPGGARVSLPAGGTWTRSQSPPAKEEVEENGEQEIVVEETEHTGPLTEAQEQEAAQNNGEITEPEAPTEGTAATTTETGTEPATESAPTTTEPTTTSEPSAPADTSPSDSGGGGGGGSDD